MRAFLVVVAWSLASCGDDRGTVSSALTQTCALASGIYVSEVTRVSQDGTCAISKGFSRDKLEFAEGAFISPAAVLIPCKTQQLECSLVVSCQVLDLDMVFKGELDVGADRIEGTLTFSGKGECKSAVYDLVATKP
jgi:hypothetical protein